MSINPEVPLTISIVQMMLLGRLRRVITQERSMPQLGCWIIELIPLIVVSG